MITLNGDKQIIHESIPMVLIKNVLLGLFFISKCKSGMPIVTFPKKEKLCGEIRIGKLFTEGKAFLSYPLRIVYKVSVEKTDSPVKVLISVPKKKFKRAVHRNRIKRLIREAYRLNKEDLLTTIDDNNQSLHLAITYIADKELDFNSIESKVKSALSKIAITFNDKKVQQ